MPHQTRHTQILLIVGGTASCAMAVLHFLLPRIYHWERFLSGVPAPIRWGLFSINVFFSTLLVCGGVASIVLAFSRRLDDWVSRSVLLTMAGFWLVNVTYQVANPFPVAGLRWILLGFAAVVLFLYTPALFQSVRPAELQDRG